jgi:hypothetical protein
MGPTYRGGALRETALRYMEELEQKHRVRSVAFEMLGPPRLSKLLFEAEILYRLYTEVRAAADLDPEDTAARALALVEADDRLRSDVLSIGIPILMPDGQRLLRGPRVSVVPDGPADAAWANRGWVDLRAESWSRWRDRLGSYVKAVLDVPDAGYGSGADLDVRARSGEIRPGSLAAYVFRFEDEGERMKR